MQIQAMGKKAMWCSYRPKSGCGWWPQTPKGARTHFSPRTFKREQGPANVLILDSWPPELQEKKLSVVPSHSVCGHLLPQAEETRSKFVKFEAKEVMTQKCKTSHVVLGEGIAWDHLRDVMTESRQPGVLPRNLNWNSRTGIPATVILIAVPE